MAALQQIPARYAHHEHCAQHPGREYCVDELIDCDRRQCHVEEGGHLVAHGVGVELLAYRMLHPRVGHENPPGGNCGAERREPCGGKVEALADLVPAKEHDGNEGRFHEEGHDALDGERSVEDVAHEVGVVAPVGAELKFEDDTCGNAHSEVNAKELLPKLCAVAPESVTSPVPTGLCNTHDDSQSKC